MLCNQGDQQENAANEEKTMHQNPPSIVLQRPSACTHERAIDFLHGVLGKTTVGAAAKR